MWGGEVVYKCGGEGVEDSWVMNVCWEDVKGKGGLRKFKLFPVI